jgi:hypothetical protein
MKKAHPSRQHSAENRSSPTAGVAWYTSSEWSRVKAAAVDPERFEASFEDWLAMAEGTLVTLRKAGVAAQKCLVGADELRAWCLENGLENNAAARARFVSEQLMPRNHTGGA